MNTVPTPAVDVRGVRKSYATTLAVDDVSLSAPSGAITALLGRNGAGKTTTIRLCTGELAADAGVVQVLGCDPRASAAELRPRVGVMPQAGGSGAAGVYPAARVAEVVRLFASFAASPLDPDALLARLDLQRLARSTWRRLSGGEQQRLSLALALVGRPELVFLDEPSAGLDVHARRSIWELLEELRGAGVSIVLTTHQMEEAERLADHVVVVDRGRVVASGSPRQLTGDEGVLTFTAPAGLPIDELAARLSGAPDVQEERPGHYVVRGVVDTQAVAAVTAWCAQRGVLADRIHAGARSLEDVFVALTGDSS
jgi:ABC-2 type transport system ATP-binding protein